MTTFFKKAMLYLGLGSDEDFLGMDPQELNERPVESGVMVKPTSCLLYTSPSPRDGLLSRMPSSA